MKLFLFWLRHYLPFRLLSVIFQISKTTIKRYIWTTLRVFNQEITGCINLGTIKERLENAESLDKYKITLLLDGTEQQVYKSSSRQVEQICFSGKKSLHTFTLAMLCDPIGKIRMISPSYEGSRNDMQVISMFSSRNELNTLSDREAILADPGYRGLDSIPHQRYHVLLTNSVKEEQSEYERKKKAIRCRIENVFAMMKKFKICKNPIRFYTKNLQKALKLHHAIWVIVAYLNNSCNSIRKKE